MAKDRKQIALHNTSRSLAKKFLQSKTDEDYQKWQKAMRDYIDYVKNKIK
jgi:hypothetical protein